MTTQAVFRLHIQGHRQLLGFPVHMGCEGVNTDRFFGVNLGLVAWITMGYEWSLSINIVV